MHCTIDKSALMVNIKLRHEATVNLSQLYGSHVIYSQCNL